MKTCDSCNDVAERRNLQLTPSWVIAVCRKCFDQEMQWRYTIDKEWPEETWEGLNNDNQKIPPGRNDQTSGGSGDNVSPQA
jgi:hypothetical protein